MNEKDLDKKVMDFRLRLSALARQAGRADGIEQQPQVDNHCFPKAFQLIHAMCEEMVSWLQKEIGPTLDAKMQRIKQADITLREREEVIQQKKEELGFGVNLEISTGAQERKILKHQIDRIPQEIITLQNDQRVFEDAHFSKISIPLFSIWISVGFELFIATADVSMLVGSITRILEMPFYEAAAVIILPFISIVLLPFINAFYLKGHFKTDSKRNQIILLVMLIVGNLVLLSSLTTLFYFRSVDLVGDGTFAGMRAESLQSILIGMAYLSFIIASILAYISTPNAEGKRFLSFAKKIRAKEKEMKKLRKKITHNERRSGIEAKKALKRKERLFESLVEDKYSIAKDELQNVQEYHKGLAQGRHAFQEVKHAQREAFISYIALNTSHRENAPMPHYDVDDLMTQRYPLYDPFKSYPDNQSLEHTIIRHMNNRQTRSWWGKIAASFFYSLAILTILSSCGKPSGPETNLFVIVDGTEGNACANIPTSEEVVKCIAGVSGTDKEVTGQYGEISFFFLDGNTGYKEMGNSRLSDPTDLWSLQEAVTLKQVREFRQEVDSLHTSVCQQVQKSERSRLYSNICEVLKQITKSKPMNTTVYICSDLHEYSNFYNVYRKSVYELQRDTAKIAKLFQRHYPMPKLEGVTIILKHQKSSTIDDNKYFVLAQIYRRLLEAAGAEVQVRA